MNFFKLYIGDYQRDTAHLSMAEHGAYVLMLQIYYATEKPLPTGKALHRMLRAQDKAEREAVDAVAREFWTETDDGLVNERANEEITKANKQAETNARIAQEREERRRLAREANEASTKRETNDQPNQTPDTRHQKDSVPNGTGADAPPRDQLFGLVSPTAEQFRLSDKATRSLFGQAVKESGGDYAKVVEAVRTALRDPPLEFSAWLMGACKPKPQKLYGMDLTDDDLDSARNPAGGNGTDAAVLVRSSG